MLSMRTASRMGEGNRTLGEPSLLSPDRFMNCHQGLGIRHRGCLSNALRVPGGSPRRRMRPMASHEATGSSSAKLTKAPMAR